MPGPKVFSATGSGLSRAGSDPARSVRTRSCTSSILKLPRMMPRSEMVSSILGVEYTSSSSRTVRISPI